MLVNLDSIRAIARPYVAQEIPLEQFLERVWPLVLGADQGSKGLVEPLEALFAMHAARAISDEALRQRVSSFVFRPATAAKIEVRDVKTMEATKASVQSIGSSTSVVDARLVQVGA